MQIREDPVGRQRVPLELHIEPVTNRAVGAVTADHPGRIDNLLTHFGMAKRRRHAVRSGSELHQLNLSFHLHA